MADVDAGAPDDGLVPLPRGALLEGPWEQAAPPPGWDLEALVDPLFVEGGPFGQT